MLVELKRATESEAGEVTGEAPIAFDPAAVAAFFGSDQTTEQTLVSLANGMRYKIFGSYAEVKEKLYGNGANFVELRRPDLSVNRQENFDDFDDGEFGEDDGIGEPTAAPAAPAPAPEPRFLSVNPLQLAAIHGERNNSNQSIVKTRDGRGLIVMGTYAEVKAALEAAVN